MKTTAAGEDTHEAAGPNPYGLSAGLLKSRLEYEQAQRATFDLGKSTSLRHQRRGGLLDQGAGTAALGAAISELAVIALALVCIGSSGVAMQPAMLRVRNQSSSSSSSTGPSIGLAAPLLELLPPQPVQVGPGLFPYAFNPQDETLAADGTTPAGRCYELCLAAASSSALSTAQEAAGGDAAAGGGFGGLSWDFTIFGLRQAVLYAVVVLLAAWHDYWLLCAADHVERLELAVFSAVLAGKSWQLPLGRAFYSSAAGAGEGSFGSQCCGWSMAGLFMFSSFLAIAGAVDGLTRQPATLRLLTVTPCTDPQSRHPQGAPSTDRGGF